MCGFSVFSLRQHHATFQRLASTAGRGARQREWLGGHELLPAVSNTVRIFWWITASGTNENIIRFQVSDHVGFGLFCFFRRIGCLFFLFFSIINHSHNAACAIPLLAIDSVEAKDIVGLNIICKDGRIIR
jgi:hypothetical protein